MELENSNQVKSYLKKESKRLGISINSTYNTFFAKYLLERITNIKYGEFVIKGSFAQLVHSQKFNRPITDIDLSSSQGYSALNLLFDFFDQRNSKITYEINRQPKITPNGICSFSIYVCFDSIKHTIGIDFNPNPKILYEVQYKPIIPIFTGDKVFYINTPSYEEYMAQKLCIIAECQNIKNFHRLKDFYDIYKLHNGQYDYEKFSNYFKKMLEDRNRINIDNIDLTHLNKDLINETIELWNKNKESFEFLDKNVDYEEAVYYAKSLLTDQLLKLGIRKL